MGEGINNPQHKKSGSGDTVLHLLAQRTGDCLSAQAWHYCFGKQTGMMEPKGLANGHGEFQLGPKLEMVRDDLYPCGMRAHRHLHMVVLLPTRKW